jgi:hypothetical protein
MLSAALALWLTQARVQPVPECAAQKRLWADVGRWQEVGGYTKIQSADPAIAKVRLTRGHAELQGVAPGWVEVTLTEKTKVTKALVCVSSETVRGFCGLCDLPMSVQLSAPPVMVGEYRTVSDWALVHLASVRHKIAAPPPPPTFVPIVVAHANQALEAAGLPSRLSVVAGLPVLEPLPLPRDEGRASAALEPHLPVLLDLLGP